MSIEYMPDQRLIGNSGKLLKNIFFQKSDNNNIIKQKWCMLFVVRISYYYY